MLSKNKIVLATGLLALFGAMNAAQAALPADCTTATAAEIEASKNVKQSEVNTCGLAIQLIKDDAKKNANGVALASIIAADTALSKTAAETFAKEDNTAKLAAQEFEKLIASSPDAAKTVATAISKIIVENPEAVTTTDKVEAKSVVEGLIIAVIRVDPKILETTQAAEKVKQEAEVKKLAASATATQPEKNAAAAKLAALNGIIKAVDDNPNIAKAVTVAKLKAGSIEGFKALLTGGMPVRSVPIFSGSDKFTAVKKPKEVLVNNVAIGSEAKLIIDHLVLVGTTATLTLNSQETTADKRTWVLDTCKKPLVFGMFPVSKCAPRSKTDVAFLAFDK